MIDYGKIIKEHYKLEVPLKLLDKLQSLDVDLLRKSNITVLGEEDVIPGNGYFYAELKELSLLPICIDDNNETIAIYLKEPLCGLITSYGAQDYEPNFGYWFTSIDAMMAALKNHGSFMYFSDALEHTDPYNFINFDPIKKIEEINKAMETEKAAAIIHNLRVTRMQLSPENIDQYILEELGNEKLMQSAFAYLASRKRISAVKFLIKFLKNSKNANLNKTKEDLELLINTLSYNMANVIPRLLVKYKDYLRLNNRDTRNLYRRFVSIHQDPTVKSFIDYYENPLYTFEVRSDTNTLEDSYVELRTPDIKRCKEFYKELFGWHMIEINSEPPMADSKIDENGFVESEMRQPVDLSGLARNFRVKVGNFGEVKNRLLQLGGDAIGDLSNLESDSKWAVCQDLDGNIFHIFEGDAIAENQ